MRSFLCWGIQGDVLHSVVLVFEVSARVLVRECLGEEDLYEVDCADSVFE